MSSKSKNIVLGVSVGIAVYKACELARLLVKDGHTVRTVMTESACQFVTPLTFQALTRQPVRTKLFDLTEENQIGHIQLADQADIVVVAPATADTLAKAANGFADNLLTTILLATRAPVLFCPSMNVNMYEHAATQRNLKMLRDAGHHFVGPEAGDLACGWQGAGRLSEPEAILNAIYKILKLAA